MTIFILLSTFPFRKENIFAQLGFPNLPSGTVSPLGIGPSQREVLNENEPLPGSKFDLYFIDINHDRDLLLDLTEGINGDCTFILHQEKETARSHRYLFTELSERLPESKILYRYEHSNGPTFHFLDSLANRSEPEYQQMLEEYRSLLLNDALLELGKEIAFHQFRQTLYDEWLISKQPPAMPFLYCRLFEDLPEMPELIRTTVTHPRDSKAYKEALEKITLLLGERNEKPHKVDLAN